MLDEIEPLLKNLPPTTLNALQRAVQLCSRQLGLPPDWVQRWIAFTIVADALVAVDASGLFELKGGAAIELRLRRRESGVKPRASRDLDATFHGQPDAIETAVRAALEGVGSRIRHSEFSYRVELNDRGPLTRRFWVHVSFRGKSFSKVKLEISTYEGRRLPADLVRAYSLKAFGLEGVTDLACIPLTKQIAQKLHAMTEPPIDRNDRFRDLVDVNLLSAMVPASSALRDVCVETFAIRAKQGWPPTVEVPTAWQEPLVRLATELGLARRNAAELVEHAQEYIKQIDAASPDGARSEG